ncbi:MAG: hypothetical protein R3E08_09315 [Thiotrichaceae bacterium]
MNLKPAVYSLVFATLSFGLSATISAATMSLSEKVDVLTRSYVLCLENRGKEGCRDIYTDLLKQQTELEQQRRQDKAPLREIPRSSPAVRDSIPKPREETPQSSTDTPNGDNSSAAQPSDDQDYEAIKQQLSSTCDDLIYGSLERRNCRAEAKQRFRESCYSKDDSTSKARRRANCLLSEIYPIVE